MRKKNQIRDELLSVLSFEADSVFLSQGFNRQKGSLEYFRKDASVHHRILFAVDYFPKYMTTAELHLHPIIRVCMPAVTEVALRLVEGNKMLLANAPEFVVAQPIEFAAPKDVHERWFSSGRDQLAQDVRAIILFAEAWAYPLFEELNCSEGLIKAYRQSDERLLKQKHWYIFVAAAFMLHRENDEAIHVLETHLGAPGLRRKYSPVFASVRSDDSDGLNSSQQSSR